MFTGTQKSYEEFCERACMILRSIIGVYNTVNVHKSYGAIVTKVSELIIVRRRRGGVGRPSKSRERYKIITAIGYSDRRPATYTLYLSQQVKLSIK